LIRATGIVSCVRQAIKLSCRTTELDPQSDARRKTVTLVKQNSDFGSVQFFLMKNHGFNFGLNTVTDLLARAETQYNMLCM